MLRIGALLPAIAAFLIISAIQSVAHAQTATVPAYFFKLWQVQSNCIEQGADPASQTQVGLRYAISRAAISADGLSYAFKPINSATQVWPDGWSELRLQYRPGVQMTNIPADFACVPGQPSSSSLLAMSNYTPVGGALLRIRALVCLRRAPRRAASLPDLPPQRGWSRQRHHYSVGGRHEWQRPA